MAPGVERVQAALTSDVSPPLRWDGPARVVEQCYVVVVLLCLTVGPVTRFWSTRAPLNPTDVPNPADWTLVLVQLPALVLLGRRLPDRLDAVWWALIGLVGWLALSVAWSVLPGFSTFAATTLVLTCGTGAYLARSFRWQQLTVLTFVAMQPGLVLSRIAIERSWAGVGAGPEAAGIAGIYGNRNSLGPPAVIAVGCGAVLIALLLANPVRAQFRVPAIVGVLVTMMFDLDLQVRGGSMTSWLMLMAFLGTVITLAVVQTIPSFERRRDLGVHAGRIIVLACGAFFAVALAFNRQVSAAFDRPAGFHYRVGYWQADIDGVMERPILGWGWMAAWRSDEFRAGLTPFLARDYWSHSAYLDIALGGGFIAVGLLVVVAVVGTRSAGSVLQRTDLATAVPLAMVVAVAIGCAYESFFVGNYFLTVLLVAGLGAASGPDGLGTRNGRADRRWTPPEGQPSAAG